MRIDNDEKVVVVAKKEKEKRKKGVNRQEPIHAGGTTAMVPT